MSRRQLLRLWLVAVLCTMALPGHLAGQIRPGEALRRIREIQDRHTEQLMNRPGVVGTASGFNAAGSTAILVLLERPGVGGIPQEIEGVPVQTVVTGKIYALGSTAALAQSRWPWWFWWDRTPPAVPTGLTAEADGSHRIKLSWDENSEYDSLMALSLALWPLRRRSEPSIGPRIGRV